MAIVVNKRPNERSWSGNPIHYLLYSPEAELDPTNYFEIKIKFKRTDEVAYSDIITLPYKPVLGTVKLDIEKILDGLMEHEIPLLPTASSFPSANFSNKATGKFYIEFREITTADDDPDWDDSESDHELFVIKGGISFEKWRGDNYWTNYYDVVKPFLSWRESGRLHSLAEQMWITWLNLTSVNPSNIKIRRTLTFTDATIDVADLDCPCLENNIAYFPAGAEQLQLDQVNTAKDIWYWDLQVIDISLNPVEPLSTVFRSYLDNRNDYNDITLHYRNSLGGLDSARVRGVIDYNSQREFSQIEKIVLHDYFSGHNITGRVGADNSTELLVYKGDIGHLGKEEQDRLRDMHLKRECWWGKQEKWLPVMLLTSNQRLKLSTDKLFAMPLEFCIASGGNYYYTPDSINLQEDNTATGGICTAVINDLQSNYVPGTGWVITWNLVSGAPNKYQVSTPAVSGGAPHETTSLSYTFAWLPVGDNVITVRPVCLIGGVYYLGTAVTLTVTVAEACVGVGISSSPFPLLPDGVAGVLYNFVIPLSGTAPFNISNIVKPAWMTVSVVGSTVELTGTPSVGDIATDIEVSFDLDNCSGGNTESYQDFIDVAAAVGNGDFVVVNSGAALSSLKNVTESGSRFWSLSTGTMPVTGGLTSSGILTRSVSNPISVFVIVPGPGYSLTLLKNGVAIENIPTPGGGTYSFAAVAFLITDDMEIQFGIL